MTNQVTPVTELTYAEKKAEIASKARDIATISQHKLKHMLNADLEAVKKNIKDLEAEYDSLKVKAIKQFISGKKETILNQFLEHSIIKNLSDTFCNATSETAKLDWAEHHITTDLNDLLYEKTRSYISQYLIHHAYESEYAVETELRNLVKEDNHISIKANSYISIQGLESFNDLQEYQKELSPEKTYDINSQSHTIVLRRKIEISEDLITAMVQLLEIRNELNKLYDNRAGIESKLDKAANIREDIECAALLSSLKDSEDGEFMIKSADMLVDTLAKGGSIDGMLLGQEQ